MILPLLLLLLLWVSWKFYSNERQALVCWRRTLFLTGIVINAVSLGVLLSFLIHAYIVAHGRTPLDIDRMYPVLSMLGLSLVASIFSLFGGRVARLVLLVNGFATAILWYLAALATSP
jgi:hypothetical protein